MYRFVYNGKKICDLKIKEDSVLPSCEVGDIIGINGINYKVRYRKTVLKANESELLETLLERIEVHLVDVNYDVY